MSEIAEVRTVKSVLKKLVGRTIKDIVTNIMEHISDFEAQLTVFHNYDVD